MKVAITSKGKDLDALIDVRFGRAAGFVVVDIDSGEFEYADNSMNLNAAQGSGIQAAANIEKLGATVVITGHCGPNAFRTLTASGIKVYLGTEGTAREMIEKFKAGQLEHANDADVEGHWT